MATHTASSVLPPDPGTIGPDIGSNLDTTTILQLPDTPPSGTGSVERTALDRPILDFYRHDGPDLLAKCRDFHAYVEELARDGTYPSLYRVKVLSGLDHRISVFDEVRGAKTEMICFDSNSYLGLHRHPDVVAAVKSALDQVGYGTPSAQLLCGTNRYLIELEETVAAFHGRAEAMIFPSGYSANLGALGALLRKPDLVAVDRFSHASIHDGVNGSAARRRHVFPHRDMEALDHFLSKEAAGGSGGGKLIASDGVFSMHGTLAPLPQLRALATRHRATLMIDEAHATGVIGPNGRGLEDHFGMAGAIDVLVGTFSKAAGTAGGYVCGSSALISYMRAFASAGVFSATLPASTCAGLIQAFLIMDREPEHRHRLWNNVHSLAPALHDAGLSTDARAESPIITVFMGTTRLLRRFSRDLFASGIKCGNVDCPAVPAGEAIVRLAVNARHTADDLAETVETFQRIGRKYDMLHRSRAEIQELGKFVH